MASVMMFLQQYTPKIIIHGYVRPYTPLGYDILQLQPKYQNKITYYFLDDIQFTLELKVTHGCKNLHPHPQNTDSNFSVLN